MSIEGIWTSEIMGLFGWESIGIMLLENGRAVGGGNHHYSIGSYSVDEDNVTLDTEVCYHGTPRTIFGKSDNDFKVNASLKVYGETIEGEIHRIDRPGQYVAYRMIRRADVPSPG